MSEKPILFNAEMVRAILAGRKTQTRRIVKPQPDEDGLTMDTGKFFDTGSREYRPPYREGDVLYVRETWSPTIPSGKYVYRADCRDSDGYLWPSIMEDRDGVIWRPSIHMPKDAARIFLKVKKVRCRRLHNITGTESKAEGVIPFDGESARDAFVRVWRICYGDLSWTENPWVWVIEFEKVKK